MIKTFVPSRPRLYRRLYRTSFSVQLLFRGLYFIDKFLRELEVPQEERKDIIEQQIIRTP